MERLPFEAALRRTNVAIGLAAVFLPIIVALTSYTLEVCETAVLQDSISHSYFAPISGGIFMTTLSFVGAALLFFYEPYRQPGYDGHTSRDVVLAKTAGLAAILVAILPTTGTGCPGPTGAMMAFVLPDGTPVQGLPLSPVDAGMAHSLAAAVLFTILGYYSLVVFRRIQRIEDLVASDKRTRNKIYAVCGWIIFTGVAALVFGLTVADPEIWTDYNMTFWIEAIMLWAFGVSWMLKGRIFGWLDSTVVD